MAGEADTLPLIRTKLQRPRLPGDLIPRRRLLDRLRAGADRKLTLVSAMAGAGKSTLLAQWLDECPQPSAWLSLDEHDNDLPLGTSPFIAAFAAGLALQVGFRDAAEGVVEFSENEGRLLHMFVFFLFGTVAGPTLGELHLAPVLYAVLSLTLVRMLPVAISMIGTRLSAASLVFMGWFGPRGLASIVLGLVVAGQGVQTAGSSLVREGLIATVLLSIFAHGLSVSPGIRLYARQISRLGADAPEYEAVPGMPTT